MANLVAAEAYERVIQLESAAGAGAAFTITMAERQWLVTARHLLPAGDPAPEVVLANRFGSLRLRLGFVPAIASKADIAVAPLETPVTPEIGLHATSEGVVFSQVVFLLGYPYGMGLDLGGHPRNLLPFIKQGIVSAGSKRSGVHLWFLDAHGNPGFSGGPVVARTARFQTMQVIGVIAGNRAADRPVLVGEQKLEDLVVRENTGIVVATDIRHAIDVIRAESR